MNCALWSAEVFEDDDGSLKNVHIAVLRGKLMVRQETLSSFKCTFVVDNNNLFLLLFLFSAVRSVISQGPQLAAASPLAPIITTSCVLAKATASSWKTRKFTVQSTEISSKEK